MEGTRSNQKVSLRCLGGNRPEKNAQESQSVTHEGKYGRNRGTHRDVIDLLGTRDKRKAVRNAPGTSGKARGTSLYYTA